MPQRFEQFGKRIFSMLHPRRYSSFGALKWPALRLMGGLLALGALGCSAVSERPAIAPVQSRSLTRDDPLASYRVTIHVILQVHENPVESVRALQDQTRVDACQQNLVSIALKIADRGVRAVVVEGIYGAGTLEKPQPVVVAELTDKEREEARWLLAERTDLAVYGFELKPLNEFGYTVVNQLGSAIARLRDAARRSSGNAAAQEQERALLQEEVTRLNLWHAGVVAERSFLALQTALAVALARGENQVQLVIGKEHWSDLVYAINRQRDVRLRLIPYSCE